MGTTTIQASDLMANLAETLDTVNADNIVAVTRRGKKEKAIIDVNQLEDLLAESEPSCFLRIRIEPYFFTTPTTRTLVCIKPL